MHCRLQHFKRMPSSLRHGPREDITGVETPLFLRQRVCCAARLRAAIRDQPCSVTTDLHWFPDPLSNQTHS